MPPEKWSSKRTLKRLSADQSAQASIEYILLLLAAMGFILLLYRKLLKPVFARLADVLSNRLNDLLRRESLHRLPFKRH